MPIQKALLSVSDKSGLAGFAERLAALDIELLSTGGTSKALVEAELEVTEIDDYTGSPELFGGRVKTLHPKVHGGILHRRDNKDDLKDARKHDVPAIDLVVVNLYPFEETIRREGVTLEEAIEQIDVGGPTMIRAAAKNYKSVAIVVDPADYDAVADELEANDGETSLATRERLAIKAFQRTAAYDTAISTYLNEEQRTGKTYNISLPLSDELRYGENPHQEARLYGNFGDYFVKLQGKDYSYTNILDMGAAAALISEFKRPAVAILKHTNPCGIGTDDTELRAAWDKAYETDKQAPFGGVIICNRPLDLALARVISEIFTDIVIAPEYEADARALLQKKKTRRLVQMKGDVSDWVDDPVIRSIPGGLAVMDADPKALGITNLEEKVVTKRPPSESELAAMRFAWRVVKHVKSNAIVFASTDRTLAIGAGQMSRVDAAKLAVWKGQEAGISLEGSAVASDAMFPFPDGLVAAAEAGATCAIQPGGSMRDEEVIAAADEHGIAMCFTEKRHFLH